MHEMVEQLFRPVGPIETAQFNISVTNSSVHWDLSGSGDADLAGLVAAINAGLVLELKADDDVGFLWSTAASGGVVALAATASSGTAAQQCKRLFAGESDPQAAPRGTKGIIVVSVVAATILRITVASRQASYWVKNL